MKRIIVLLTVVALMMVMLAMSVAPVLAQEGPPNTIERVPVQACDPGQADQSPVIVESDFFPCFRNPALAPTP